MKSQETRLERFFSRKDYGGYPDWQMMEALQKANANMKNEVPSPSKTTNMATRCKFQCDSVEHTTYGRTVKLQARYSNNKPEDNQFSAATPSGSMQMVISNPEVYDFFVPGKDYYLDISPAE